MGGFSFDGGKYVREEIPAIKKVDILSILDQHKYRWVLNTSKGTVVMKHISKRMKDYIDQMKYIRFPSAMELEEEAAILYPLAMAEGSEDDVKARAHELGLKLVPIMDIYGLGCIEYPFLTSFDDLDAFMDSLLPDEREAVRQLLFVLRNWNDEVDYTKLEFAERFHVQLVEREHITDPTYMQYLALRNVIAQEHQQTERLYKQMGVLE